MEGQYKGITVAVVRMLLQKHEMFRQHTRKCSFALKHASPQQYPDRSLSNALFYCGCLGQF